MLIQPIKQRLKLFFLIPITGVSFYGCIEPFNAQLIDFESALVVEATITNEMKQQQIFLTRAFEFEADGPSSESNANVRVVSGSVTFDFEEIDPGVYISTQAFAAQPNATYELHIDTQDGKSYRSDEMSLPSITQMDDLRAERIINEDGEDGIAILVDSFDPTGSSLNYRYTYEEVYRIIAPEWRPVELVPDPEAPGIDGCDMKTVPKQINDRVCYATVISNSIIQTNTGNLEEDRVSNFVVRFINRNNYIISHRYSILVRQFVQSNTAFSFYETLAQFSSSESLLSETQPGFLEGNIFSKDGDDEKVLGFFDVSSVTEQRIFFNYTDFYPDEPLPPYAEPCLITSIPLRFPMGGCRLRPAIEEFNSVRFLNDNNNPDPLSEGPFFTVPRACGDCTALGELEVPEFWTE